MITTARLLLRPFADRDRAAFAAMNADPEVMRHFPAIPTREESDAMIDRALSRWENDGIAFGGLFTGAEELKTEEQAARYGGTAGIALDPCYHAACDNLGNIDARALEINGDAMAFVTSWLSHSTKVIDDQIEAGKAAGPSLQRAAKAYDITHWGKHWIK